MKRHFKWDRTYVNWGITAFCVIAASLLFFFAVKNVSVIGATIGNKGGKVASIVGGVILILIGTKILLQHLGVINF